MYQYKGLNYLVTLHTSLSSTCNPFPPFLPFLLPFSLLPSSLPLSLPSLPFSLSPSPSPPPRPYQLGDVEVLDLGFYNSLKFVLENDPAPLELTFTVLEESFGEVGNYDAVSVVITLHDTWHSLEPIFCDLMIVECGDLVAAVIVYYFN